MSETVLTIAMWIGGGISTLLFFIVSLWLKRSIKSYDDLADSVNKLQMTLTGLNGIILSIQERNDMSATNCRDRHGVIDTRLREHSQRLDEHDKQITRLETLQEK